MTHTTPQPADRIYVQPAFHPALTWGLGAQRVSYEPGPGGPLPGADPRAVGIKAPGPVYGRVGALSALRAFSPGNLFPMIYPWPQMIVNNRYGTNLLGLFVPGWSKPAPTSMSGF